MLSELANAPLTTVQDARQFFVLLDDLRAQGKPLPPINHVFFARVDDGLSFEPYHIQAVSKANRPNNYYIVTKTHVVHVNRMLSTFETLGTIDDWLMETKLFYAVRKLAFFRTYVKAKALNRLVDALRAKKFARSRTLVGKQLLIAHSMFSKEVADLAALSLRLRYSSADSAAASSKPRTTGEAKMAPVRSLYIWPAKRGDMGFTVDEFNALQNKHLRELKKYIAEVLVEIVAVVVDKARELEEKVAALPPLVNPKASAIVGAVNKEVAAGEQRERERHQKRVYVAFNNVARLTRLAHHMQTEAIFAQVCTSMFELRKLVTNREACHNSAWFFKLDCAIEGSRLFLSPHREPLLEHCRRAITNCLGSLVEIPTTANSARLESVTVNRLPARGFSNIFADDALLSIHIEAVINRVGSDYDEAAKKLPMYEALLTVADFSSQWMHISAGWAANLSTGLSTVDRAMVAEFRVQISKALMLQTEVKRLSNHAQGTVFVSCEAAISAATVKLEQIVEEFCTFISNVSDSQRTDVDSKKTEWIRQLETPELVLDDYVAWVLKMRDVEDHMDSFVNRVSDLQSLFQLRTEVADKISSERDVEEVDFTKTLRDPLLTALSDAKQFHSANITKMRDRVVAEHKKIVASLQETQSRLEDGFSSPKANESGLALRNLDKVQESLSRRRQEASRLEQHAEMLGMSNLNWSEIGVTGDCLKKFQELWKVAEETERLKNRLQNVPVSELDGQDLKDTVVSLFQRAFKCSKLVPGSAADNLVKVLGEEKSMLPLYVELCNPALKEEHWSEIFALTKVTPIPTAARTLQLCQSTGLLEGHSETITSVVSDAVGTFEVEENIRKVEAYFDERKFKVAPYAGRNGAFVIDGTDEILEELEEQQVVLQTCLASKYVGAARAAAESWEEKLTTMQDVITEWVSVQKSWMYLEFIFSSDDIKRQLPNESLLFSSADRFFSGLMKRAQIDAHVLPLCMEGGDALKKLQKCRYQLDCIQKKLDDYLETKRVAFPRFYFLSNDELLSILSDSRNPLAVQPHLQKCFDNIKELVFSDPKTVTGMKSSEGEVVSFSQPVRIMGNVESWLNDVERAMRETLYDRMAACVADYSHDKRTTWFFAHPAQCVSTTDQIIWTGEVEGVIANMQVNEGSWATYMTYFRSQLLETVELVKCSLATLERTVVTNLIVVNVHCRDVCTQLAAAKTSSVGDFDWQKQLRFYWTRPFVESVAQDCVIRHGAAQLSYGYEYLGNQPRLVITPLTERAFLTCTAALHMQKGAAPQGPAGTGKTESVKDLGKALARQVVVFNCSDGLNYKMMSQMFAGLAQGGAWACFDEFNRIELEVLSVVAQQMLDITTAITNKQTSMSFEGHQIKLHPNFGVFITMNPGYAGRTELPDNLKALFRPICMMIPNYALIAEIMFYSEGYTNAGALAGKMVRLYSLASQQLSKQDHYDFGMRAVKSILVLAGRLKRAEPDTDEDLLLVRAIRDANLPKFLTDDTHLFLALMRDFFPGVTEVAAGESNLVVGDAARRVLESTLKLEPTWGTITKNQQLFDTLTTRHGLMLVGRTMTGKSTIRETLARALTDLGRTKSSAAPGDAAAVARLQRLGARFLSYMTPTDQWTCNPKSISMTELYGDVNSLTREWQDGIFSSIVRELVKEGATASTSSRSDPARHWIVFDGPVDAVWIENLNTVLDDSKMLCLVNGERIRIPETISLLFEVQDLRVASPATVSRCGMVYVDEEVLDDGWSPLLRSLSRPLAARLGSRWRQARFDELCATLVPGLLRIVRAECREYISTVNAQLARNMFIMLRTALEDFVKSVKEEDQTRQASSSGHAAESLFQAAGADDTTAGAATAAARRGSTVRRRSSVAARASAALLGNAFFDALFIQSCVWGIGGNLADGSRARFSTEMLRLVRRCNLRFPEDAEAQGRGVYDYCVDMDVGDWRPWSELVPPFHYDASLSFFDLVVPTEHTVMLNFLLHTATTARHHLLLNGLTGTAKSSTVANFMTASLKTEDATSAYVSFAYTLSAQTSSSSLQETIESKLAKRKGERELGPPHGKQVMIAVIDDCNVPQLEGYGAAPPVELLRQLVSQGGFYDRKKLFFKEVVQTMLIACCGEPGGGKNEMTQRFTSAMLAFCVPQLSHAAMRSIYLTILESFYVARSFPEEVSRAAGSVVDSTLAVYRRIMVECLPTPEKTHYTFNLRDVSKVVQGMLQIKPAHCGTRSQLISLWSHEASRVFHDRLVDDTDRAWWWRCVQETVAEHFGSASTTDSGGGDNSGDGNDADLTSEEVIKQVMYGTWGSRSGSDYQQIAAGPATEEAVYASLAEYNVQSPTPMDLVFFGEAVQHLSRICRAINQPRGHLLLIGVGGSGRSSLCRLAAMMMNMDLQTPSIARGYGIEEFREEVRRALLDAGARGKEVVFLLSDPQIVCSEMLEDINNVLNTGEVPGLMRMEDMEVIVRYCREDTLSAGKPDTRGSVYQYFVSRCRERLHVALCMSPMSGKLRDRLRTFPALVSCTTMDWVSDWPAEALRAVATAVLSKASDTATTTVNTVATTSGRSNDAAVASTAASAKVGELMVFIHRTVQDASHELFRQLRRRNYTTPTSYLAALALFQKMARDLRTRTEQDANRYRVGLEKLESANATVVKLQGQIREMQPVLAAAAEAAATQQQTVRAQQAEADVLKQAMAKEEAAAQGLMSEAESIRRECEEGLAEALPALEAASRALETITAKDIQEIKTFATPPSNVEKTMNAVLVLLKEKEGWANAKACLNRMDFMSRLTEYPRDEMSPAIIRRVATFVNDPDFVPEVIEKTSLPCRSMCVWVRAMHTYFYVAKGVAPKRERLRDAEERVAAARLDLASKQAALQSVQERIASLEVAARAAQDKADTLDREMETARARLQRADQLTSGLASERGRWTESLHSHEARRGRVLGTAALGAGCVAYLGPFPTAFRAELIARWRVECERVGLAVDDDFALERMTPEATVQQWALQSLPRDAFSVQNATILERSPRWCYIIDPQGQMATFIRRREAGASGRGLLVLKQTDDNFMRSIENALQVGQPVLLEGVGETLDAALDPILLRQVRRVGGRPVVTLGDREVPYDDAFRLYMTTTLPNPVLTPELQVKVTVLNGTVTRGGLEDQLLADVVGVERAALQRSSDRCVVSIASSRQEIRALEEQVLRMLGEAAGDVLDNVELVNALQVSKTTSVKIAQELMLVEETNRKITAARERYRGLAARGSLLYGVIADLARVDPMYEYSLPFFKSLVVSVLKNCRRQRRRESERHRSGSASSTSRRSLPRVNSGSGSLGDTDKSDKRSTEQENEKENDEDGEEADAPISDEELDARVVTLLEELTWTAYRVVCRGLFERHKLLFSFLLATAILRAQDIISEAEWDVFVRGGVGREVAAGFAEGVSSGGTNEAHRPPYMHRAMWMDLGALCALPPFTAIAESFVGADGGNGITNSETAASRNAWAEWFTHVHGEEVLPRMPAPALALDRWHLTMLLKVIRPEKLRDMVRGLVGGFLGDRYTCAPAFRLREVFRDSTKATPIIFILSPGTDPTALFTSFAEEMGFAERRYMLSLGQDQGPRARRMIENARREGCWVYLQNCHVYASWMGELQRLVEETSTPGSKIATDTHDDYRLWLTSSPSPAFPAAVLQAGMKLTREPPLGLRGKVRDTLMCDATAHALSDGGDGGGNGGLLGSSGPDSARGVSSRNNEDECDSDATTRGRAMSLRTASTHTPRWRQLAVSLALLHGIVLERRSYGPLGWNIPYDWSGADFTAGLSTITTALSRMDMPETYSNEDGSSSLPSAELTFMLGTIDYGGRVTDAWDTRCLEVMARQFFGDGHTSGSDGDRNTHSSGLGGGLPPLPESCTTLDSVLSFVDTHVPDGTAAAAPMFGLHANADISVDKGHSAELVECLVRISAGGSGGDAAANGGSSGNGDGAGSGESLVAQVARGLLQRLPDTLPACHVGVAPTVDGRNSAANVDAEAAAAADAQAPLRTLLAHETDLYNRLLSEMRSTLRELLRALKGEEVMTPRSERMAVSLNFNQVPDAWRSVGYLTRKPLAAYFDDLLRRIEFIDSWRHSGTSPPSFWLPGLFFPQGFVTAVLQSRARTLRVPIDSLQYRYRVLSPAEGALARSRTTPDLVGAYVHGLFLEGCGWDDARGGLVEPRPGALTVGLPVVHCEPVAADAPPMPGVRYECPLYKVSSRAGTLSTTGVSTNFVASLMLPSLDGMSADHWTLRGVAALCSLDV